MISLLSDIDATTGSAILYGAAVPLAALAYYQLNKNNSRKEANKIRQQLTSSPRSGGGCGCHADLNNHTNVFKKQIINVTGTNVYVAVGYALANCIMIEGDEGIVIIDTTESKTAAKEILKDFRKITTKPIKGIVCTHFHHDHVAGNAIFKKDADEDIPIWSHWSTPARVTQFNSVMGPIAYQRATKMYGVLLETPALENCGIGPFLGEDDDIDLEVELPTHTYDGPRHNINIAGIELELIHCPGETDDHTVIYYAKHGILFAGDNYYQSFPNIYTIRGAPDRDASQWARSLDVMLSTKPEILVPSHTLPIYGPEAIQTRLQDYRDAIQYVNDQTIKKILEGKHPDEIASELKLPAHLASQECLKQYYGTVGWSAKQIYTGLLGWYSGDETELHPLPPLEKAKRMIDLAGGKVQTVLDKAQSALDAEDYQWALELSSAVLKTKDCLRHSRSAVSEARRIKAAACTALGAQHTSANGRNWYLTSALMTSDPSINLKIPKDMRKQYLLTSPWSEVFEGFKYRLKADPDSAKRVEKSLCFVIHPDDDGDNGTEQSKKEPQCWTLHIRNCVLYVKNERMEKSDIVLDATESSLRQLFANPSSAASNLWSSNNDQGFELKKGRWMDVIQFFRNIDRNI